MNQSPFGHRIAVVGTSGCGKTFIVQVLARRLQIPYVCNDKLIWGPEWTPVPREERAKRFRAALAGDTWTFDGNFGGLLSPEDKHVLERVDAVVWLDLPRRVVMGQLLRRTFRRVWTREALWHGNRETWRGTFFSRDSIVWWAWKTFALCRSQYAAFFAASAHAGIARIRLTSRQEIKAWTASIPAADSRGGVGKEASTG